MLHTVWSIKYYYSQHNLKILKASLFDLNDFEQSKIQKSSRFEIQFHPELEQIDYLLAENLRRVSSDFIEMSK